MSKADGQGIKIKFTQAITSDVSTLDIAAFAVTGQEYDMQPGGELIAGDYAVDSIAGFDSVNENIDLSGGTLSDLIFSGGVLTLARREL